VPPSPSSGRATSPVSQAVCGAPGLGATPRILLLAVLLLGAGCALPSGTEVPSAPPPLPEARERARAATLHRDGLRALRPPRGQAADPDRAARLIEEAARLGDPEAQLLLAGSHLYRPDGSRDAAAALPWLHRAAQQGQPEAQYRLARLLEAGDGTPRDAGWAALWFHRAAERGHPEATFAFAMLQVAGEGTAQDLVEALARFTLAERRGVAAAARYRRALAARIPVPAARAATARVAAETARGPVAAVDRPLVRFAQSALARRGTWTVAVDGRDGPAIRAALAEFARAERLPPGAPFDPAVMDRLRPVLR
jgi:TPR repeat protein